MARERSLWPWLLLAGVAGVALVSAFDELPQRIAARIARLGAGWDNLHPEFKRRALAVLAEANRAFASEGLAVGLHSGWRDLPAQKKLIGTSATRVADPLDSHHVWGLAGDFVFLDRFGRWTWLPRADRQLDARWLKLGEIFRRHGLVWGADWDSDGNIAEHLLIDAPHAQLPLTRLADLKALYRTPAAFIAQHTTSTPGVPA